MEGESVGLSSEQDLITGARDRIVSLECELNNMKLFQDEWEKERAIIQIRVGEQQEALGKMVLEKDALEKAQKKALDATEDTFMRMLTEKQMMIDELTETLRVARRDESRNELTRGGENMQDSQWRSRARTLANQATRPSILCSPYYTTHAILYALCSTPYTPIRCTLCSIVRLLSILYPYTIHNLSIHYP